MADLVPPSAPGAPAGVAERPPVLWREELRRAWRELRGATMTPGRAAAAMALGLFIGSIPIYGCHTPIVLTVCLLLQLDALVAWVASNISNPFFSPALLTAEVQVGAWVHTGQWMRMHDLEQARQTGFSGMVLYLFTGAFFVAAALALVGAAGIFLAVRIKRAFAPAGPRKSYQLPANAPPWWRAVERVASRYAPIRELSTPADRTRFNYVRIKLLGDPVTKMITDLLGAEAGGLGEVLDIGTGRGQLPIVLLELGLATAARGIDWDEGKIEAARHAAEAEPSLDACFEVADVAEADLPPADTVLLIDVVHYLTVEQQDDLLQRAARAVRPGGRLVVREADTERGWRSWATLAEELFFTLVRFNRGARVRFRAASQIVARMEAEGLRCRIEPAWGRTPFSNVLIVGERPAAEAREPTTEED